MVKVSVAKHHVDLFNRLCCGDQSCVFNSDEWSKYLLPSTMLIYLTDCAVVTNHVYLIQMSGQSICSVFADLMCMSTTSFYNMISNGNNLNDFLLPWTMKSLYKSTHIEMGSKTLIYLILDLILV